jgi:choline dehydrogenase-like flavoprotein
MISPWELSDLYARADNIAQQTGRTRERLIAQQFEDNRGQIEYIFDVGNWSPYFKTEPGKKYATMLQMLQYPFSRGSVHIPARSGDHPEVGIDDKPVIDPRYYLGHGAIDKKMMAFGQRMTDWICSTEPLSKIIIGRVLPPATEPGSEEQTYEDFVSDYTVTDWHRMFIYFLSGGKETNNPIAIGTCAMGGREGIKAGVVDARLRVYGVRGLRVIDASIMPLQVGAHIQATVYAIAEKGAAMIREDWSNPQ